MLPTILEFAFATLAILVAANYLTKSADHIGAATGMGASLAGLVLLAAATSLPELSVNASAALMDSPDIVAGNTLGSSLYNLLILAFIDLIAPARTRMLSPIAAAHALSALMGSVLMGIAMLFIILPTELFPPELQLLGIGPGAWLIGLAYFTFVRLIYFDQRYAVDLAKARRQHEGAEEEPVSRAGLGRSIAIYLAATVVIFIASYFIARSADRLAVLTGLGGSFIGTALVSICTSLPELSTTLAAVRMKSYDMAVGNIFGSNAFNMAVLCAVDVLYQPNSLLAVVDESHAVTACAVIIITAVALMGILYRAEKKYVIVEPDALLIIGLSIGALVLVYHVGVPQ